MRFGLVGTGHWARATHAPALLATSGVTLAGIWGRDPGRTSSIAAAFDTRAYDDYDALLDVVDAVAFSVPPDVQAPMAATAARAGKHLLLEKPIAHDADGARSLEAAVLDAGVASVVFFTQLFRPEVRAWLAECAAAEHPWEGGLALALGSVQREEGVFSTPWRLERDGGLWDLGPHALSMVVPILGPVVSVAAHEDRLGTVHLVLEHRGGASSTATVSQAVPSAASTSYARLWGGSGHTQLPDRHSPVVEVLSGAVAELVAAAEPGAAPHPYGVTFGREIVDTLATAQEQLANVRHTGQMSAQ
ncbi:Gfo/Idh/MocA family protein [Jiangella asiatica]|uniref:Gfo/Idh/MocA family oxidoreductase n=1 Tax=Jiangella asiatica TaxID=2530372 RepID=A0A4R5CIR2_9ACTN|nr:Gfo/Idh/MocA family oxidoreductase [Jiangella asiatica]TDE00102.1 Gfo/Idh/MocA family oxidoreductase [Jiangella asiatica]